MSKRKMSDLVAEAEEGFDVSDILRRRVGRPTLGSAPSTVESVRLSPELKRSLVRRAKREGLSVSEAIRMAVETWVAAP